MQLENGGLQMLCLQEHVTCTQGRHRLSGRSVEHQTTFWQSMLSAVSLLFVSAHFTPCSPFIDTIINNARCACENIEKL